MVKSLKCWPSRVTSYPLKKWSSTSNWSVALQKVTWRKVLTYFFIDQVKEGLVTNLTVNGTQLKMWWPPQPHHKPNHCKTSIKKTTDCDSKIVYCVCTAVLACSWLPRGPSTRVRFYFGSALMSTSSAPAGRARKLGKVSHGLDRSNLRNSCANSTGSTTTRLASSS